MTRILINFVLIFTIIFHVLMIARSDIYMLDYRWNRRNITYALKEMDLIQLMDFQQPLLIAQSEIDSNSSDLNCKYFKPIRNIRPKSYKGVGRMECHGWIDSCQSFKDDITRKNPAMYCYSDRNKRLEWAQDTHLTRYGYNTGKCRTIPLQSAKDVMPKNDHIKNTCLCKCTKGSWDNSKLKTINWAFSLQPQISNIDNNRIVTGVRIGNHNKTIYLEIRESQIDSNEEDSWKSPDYQKKLIRDVDYSILEPDSRSINLDKILMPSNYVVTGVKFTKIPTTYAIEQNWILRLEVQGTQFDLATRKLIMGTSKWFNSDAESHDGQKRSSISMKRLNPSSPVTNNNEIYELNTYIKFTTTELNRDFGRFTIPYLSTRPVQSDTRKMLNGIGLLYKGRKDYAGFIVPEIYVSEINIDFRKNATMIITGNGNEAESFMDESVKGVIHSGKNQIESGVSNGNIIKKTVMDNVIIDVVIKNITAKEYITDESSLITDKRSRAYESVTELGPIKATTKKNEKRIPTGRINVIIITESSMPKSGRPSKPKDVRGLKGYSELKKTEEIMTAENAFEETRNKQSVRITKQSTKNIIMETTSAKNTIIGEQAIDRSTLEATIEKRNMTKEQTTVSITTDGRMQKELSTSELLDISMPHVYLEENTREEIMRARNAIEKTTEYQIATTEAQSTNNSIMEGVSSTEIMIINDVIDRNTSESTTQKEALIKELMALENTTKEIAEEGILTQENLTETTIKPVNTMNSETTIVNTLRTITEEESVTTASPTEINTTEVNTDEKNVIEKLSNVLITTERGMEIKFRTNESSENNMLDAYSEKSKTKQTIISGDTIETSTEYHSKTIAPQIESTTEKEIVSEKSVNDKNQTEATTEEENMVMTKGTAQTSVTNATTEEINMMEAHTTVSITTDESMQKEFSASELSDITMLDVYSEERTTEEIMRIRNEIETTTEYQIGTTEAQSTNNSIMEGMSSMEIMIKNYVIDRNTSEYTTQKETSTKEWITLENTTKEIVEQGILTQENLTETTIKPVNTMNAETTIVNTLETITDEESVTTTSPSEINTTEVNTDEKNVTERLSNVLITTDRGMEIKFRKNESSENNIVNAYSEKRVTMQTLISGDTMETSTEYHSTTIAPQRESTTGKEIVSEKSVNEKNQIEATTEEENMVVTEGTAQTSATNATIEEINMTEAQTTVSITTDESMQKEFSASELSDITMLDVYSEERTTEEIMRVRNGIETTTEYQIVTTEAQSTNNTIMEGMSTTEIMTENYVIDKNTFESTTQKETSTKEWMALENATKEIAEQGIVTQENPIDTTIKPKNTMNTETTIVNTLKTITDEESVTTTSPSEINTTEVNTDEKNVTERLSNVLFTTKRGMEIEFRTNELSKNIMGDAYSENSTPEEIMTTVNGLKATTENQSITTAAQTELTTLAEILFEESTKKENEIEATIEENMMEAGKTVETSTMETNFVVENIKETRNLETNMEETHNAYVFLGNNLKETSKNTTNEIEYTTETMDKKKNISKIQATSTGTEITSINIHTERAKNMSKIGTEYISKIEANAKESDFEETTTEVTKEILTMRGEIVMDKRISEINTETWTMMDEGATEKIEQISFPHNMVRDSLIERKTKEPVKSEKNIAKALFTNFNMTDETFTKKNTMRRPTDMPNMFAKSMMNEVLTNLSEINATEVIRREKNTIGNDVSRMVTAPTSNNSMADAITEGREMIKARTAKMNNTKAIDDKRTTTERGLSNELNTNGSSEISILEIYFENSTIDKCSSELADTQDCISDKITIVRKRLGVVITIGNNITDVITVEIHMDSSDSQHNQRNLANSLHLQILFHAIILIPIILTLTL